MTAPPTGQATGHATAPPRPPVLIDPRIRRRRIEVRRQEGRRRLHLLLATVAVAGAGLALWGATRSPLLDVDHVRVAGAHQTPVASVLRAARVHRGEAMTDVDPGAAARRVASLPWVARARVTRRWPGTVTITVAERHAAVAVAARGGGWALADAQGHVLTVVLAPPVGLPALDGVPPAGPPGARLDAAAANVLRVAVHLPAVIVARVAAVVPASVAEPESGAAPGDVDLRVRPTGIVRLGTPGPDLGPAMLALQTVLAQVDVHNLAVLDLRVPLSPVLTRQ